MKMNEWMNVYNIQCSATTAALLTKSHYKQVQKGNCNNSFVYHYTIKFS